jgi:hypothetical protein
VCDVEATSECKNARQETFVDAICLRELERAVYNLIERNELPRRRCIMKDERELLVWYKKLVSSL